MENKLKSLYSKGVLLRSTELHKYILDTSVLPREAELLKEIREVATGHPWAAMGTTPDSGQLLSMLLKLVNARNTIEIGIFTGYSLLVTALAIPEDGKILAIDRDRETYEMGLPIIKRAGIEDKIKFVESEALPILDQLLEGGKEGCFDFAFVDADKPNYMEYHKRIMKLVKVGGVILYDNTLWAGLVATTELKPVPPSLLQFMTDARNAIIEVNKLLAADSRIEICQVPVGDGMTICRRII